MLTLQQTVEAYEYPGRGLAIGRDADGVPFFTYWLTGRSPASQSRELVVHDREIIVRDTYNGTTSAVTTNGRPATAAVPSTWSTVTETLWTALNPSLRIAIVTVRLDEATFATADLR